MRCFKKLTNGLLATLAASTGMCKSLLITVLGLFLVAPSTQALGLRFERVMTESGGSVAETNAITQDKHGYIWIGGSNGLARYDSHNFKFFLNNPKDSRSISNNFVWDVLEDKRGRLWVATTNGLNLFEHETERFKRYLNVPNNPSSLISNDVYRLFEDSNENLWVGTRNGLDMFDPERKKFTHFLHKKDVANALSDNGVTAIFEDSQGTLWVGTRRGLNIYKPAIGGFELFRFNQEGVVFGGNAAINDVTEDGDQNLWVATVNGLYRFNLVSGEGKHFTADTSSPHSLQDNLITRLYVDSKKHLWISTDHGGLSLYKPETESFITYQHDPYDPSSLASNNVREIFEDSAGDYWVALFPFGVDYASSAASSFTVYRHDPKQEDSINHDAILSIHDGSDGKIWVGTEGGLNLFDLGSGTFERFTHQDEDPSSLSANAVLAITQDKYGSYWFGTWSGGLNRYDAKTKTFKSFMPVEGSDNNISSAYVWSLLGDSEGNLWIGTEGGSLDRYNIKTGKFKHYVPDLNDPTALSGGFMRAIIEDRDGYIWIATLQGLNRYNREDETFSRYRHQEGIDSSLPHNSVASLFEDSKQRLWVGTESGLALLNRETGQFTTYTREHGLPNNSIMGIEEDAQGFLWINTLQGLSRFNPEEETFTNFSKVNGLAGNILNRPALLFDERGKILAGSTKGLTVFNPEEIKDNTFVPPISLTGFKIFNQNVSVGGAKGLLPKHIDYLDSITLDYTQTMFSIDFAALSFRNATANLYRYKMEGFDRQWIDGGNSNTATYTNLNAGTYTFTVIGSNNNGIWNEKGKSIEIIVLPPPWRTWWAYSIYLMILAGVIYYFIWSQRQKVVFEQQKVAHLKAIDKLKDEFLANTSHELRTPLNGIIGLTEALLDHESEGMSEKAKSHLKMIAGSGRRLSNLINDILDFSKIKNSGLEINLEPTDFKHVCDSVCTMMLPLAQKKSIDLKNELPAELPAVIGDEDRLQQILYNLIGNAVKFTFAGHVRIYSELGPDTLTIFVEDTGIGIPESDLGSIFESFTQARGDAAREYEGTGLGLAVARNLIELHGGIISVSSELDKGSTFRFTLRTTTEAPVVSNKEEGGGERLNQLVDSYTNEQENEVLVTESANRETCQFHILVVDDDSINRQVLIGQLSLHDYRITEAANGGEAVEIIKADDSIDLVLLDVMMPRMTGYEAASQIRAIKPVHELPIIFITAKHLASDLVAGFMSGGNDFLIKPVSKNELLSRTKTHLLLMDVTRNLEQIVEERTNDLRNTQRALETVDNIVNLVNQQSSLEGLAKILLRESAVLLDKPDYGAFWLLNERGNAFNLISTYGDKDADSIFPASIPERILSGEGNVKVFKKGVSAFAPNEIEFIAHAKDKIDAALVMAIENEDELNGLLVFVNKAGAGEFSDGEKEIFSRLETHAISAVAKAKMLETLKRQNQRLEQTSYSDQLTGLSNRRHLIRNIPGDIALCRRRYEVAEASGHYPADADLLFILVDIDHFKMVNDTYGHNAGDNILKKFSAILKSVFRESDHIVRWGGEEFLIVVRFFDRTRAGALAERFRQEVEGADFDIGNGSILKKTCSIGYSCFPFYRNVPDAYSWEQVVEIADKCLYAAKKTQRNAWVGATGNSEDGITRSFSDVVEDMPDALKNKNIEVDTSLGDKPLNWG